VIAGDDDEVTPADLGAEIAQSVAGADLRVLNGCGHMAPIEQPGAVADALERWLSDPSDGGDADAADAADAVTGAGTC
jgi:pimeloyl-ACP methyl ester carboxylesterase